MKRRGAETGSSFQEVLNQINEAYQKAGRAVITRKAIPGKFLVNRDNSRRGLALPALNAGAGKGQARMSSGDLRATVKQHKLGDWRLFVPESKAEPDYAGALAPDGRAIYYDAKTTSRTALDFDNLHAHQVVFLEQMARVGAAAGFLVEFSKQREVFFLPIQVLTLWRAESARKSLPHAFFTRYLIPASAGKGMVVHDYLTAIEEQENKYGHDYLRFRIDDPALTAARGRAPAKKAS
ncbi:MAG: Holliday junction resolvase RecU [Blastocatellia bacterium]